MKKKNASEAPMFGNFGERKSWSKIAENYFTNEVNTFPKKQKPSHREIAYKEVRAFYVENWHEKVRTMVDRLVEELYQPSTQPEPIRQLYEDGDPKTFKMIGYDLKRLLLEFGHLGILFSDGKEMPVEVLKHSMWIRDDLYLTQESIGMPVSLFLLLMGNEASETTVKVLSEWSGIRPGKLNYVYKQIVRKMRIRNVENHDNFDIVMNFSRSDSGIKLN